MTDDVVLLLTHSGDYYTIDLVEAAVRERGARPVRLNTDTYPTELMLTVDHPVASARRQVLSAGGEQLDLDAVKAIWARRLWPGRLPADMDPQMAAYARKEARTAFFDTLSLVDARWVNPLQAMMRAESKLLQLKLAAEVGLTLPATVVTNDPAEARAFWEAQEGRVVTKLLGALTQTMNATGDFMYTSRVSEADLEALDGLRLCPQIFQGEVHKASELRCIVVGDEVYTGAIHADATFAERVDWRTLTKADNVPWVQAALPDDVSLRLIALCRRLDLTYGAADLIVTPEGEHVFLEVNPAGEWGWLQRDLDLPIAEAIAATLLGATPPPATGRSTLTGGSAVASREASTAPGPTPSAARRKMSSPSDKPQVLIVTRSDDNKCIQTVSEALLKRGAQPLRLNTDRYPDLFRVSTEVGGGQAATRQIRAGDDVVELDRLTAVWYRRFHAAAALPQSLGDMRMASVQESRRTLFGFIAGLPCFHLDPLESVRRCDHKELQLERAQALGLDVPRTLITNAPDRVRPFFDACGGKMITKMQHSFAIYREGIENVVFTNVIDEDQLHDLDGLKYCPMTFQEHLEKVVELRVTVVGTKVMAASIDSTRQANTAVDWRRDGIGLINDWKPYDLDPKIADGLVALLAELGLNYGAADFIVTPDGRTVFLEVNAVGEFFWLDMNPGLPISETIAEVLLGQAPRNPVNVEPWRNYTGAPLR